MNQAADGPQHLTGIVGLTTDSVLGSRSVPQADRICLMLTGTRIDSWQVNRGCQDGAVLDGQGCTLLPGFIDLHIHGSAGADVLDATQDSLAQISQFLAKHGVTSFYPSTVTAPHQDILAAVQNVAHVLAGPPTAGARILGVHLEGPYISPEFPGAQNPAFVRSPNLGEFDELCAAGPVRLITLAPEVAGASALIQRALDAHVRVVLGHTAATFEEATVAIQAGVSQATHTYNAMTGLHHRRPGTLGAVLSHDDIYAQLIADNIHVHPAAMKILARCKGPARTLLISDAIRAAGMPDGRYEMGKLPVIVQEGACRLEDGTLAGSVLTMDVALGNFLQASGWSLADAWPVTSLNQAQAMGIDHDVGRIEEGHRADLVLLDAGLQVVASIVDGRLAYLRDPWRLG